jgi:membrane-bound lytic murein transglycosylase B
MASVDGNDYEDILGSSLEPDRSYRELREYGVTAEAEIADDVNARLFRYETEDGDEFWLGLDNFYVITRYNHSPLYAMAVYQLSREILQGISE